MLTRDISNFINLYIEYSSIKSFSNMKIKDILNPDNDFSHTKLAELLKIIKEKDIVVFENILAWDDENFLLYYLKIIQRYRVRRKAYKLTHVEVSKSSGVPVSTVKRIESLHSTPTISTLYKMLKAVGLKLNITC